MVTVWTSRATTYIMSHTTTAFSVFYYIKTENFPKNAPLTGGVYSTERNGTERNNGLNCGTERFLKLKLCRLPLLLHKLYF